MNKIVPQSSNEKLSLWNRIATLCYALVRQLHRIVKFFNDCHVGIELNCTRLGTQLD